MKRYLPIIGDVFLGFFVAVLVVRLVSPIVPETTCRSGWASPSIGRSGACSHHGGVASNPIKSLAGYAALGLGIYAPFARRKLSRRIRRGMRSDERRQEEEEQAQISNPYLEGEAVRKKAGLPKPVPFGCLEKYEQHLRSLGVSEEAIRKDLERYRNED